MLTSTTNATEHGTHRGITFADFSVYNAWQFCMCNVRRNFIFETKTLICTHWIKRSETSPFRATPTILASPNGFSPQGSYLDWAPRGKRCYH